MRIQSHKLKNYGKGSTVGELFAHFFPEKQECQPEPEVKPEPKPPKLELPPEEARLSRHSVSRANRKSGSDFGFTGWGSVNRGEENQSLNDMLRRLKKH